MWEVYVMHWNAPLPVALESKGLLGSPENVIILVVEHPKSYVSYTIKHQKTLKDHTFPFQSCAGQHPFEIRDMSCSFWVVFLEKELLDDTIRLVLEATFSAQKGGEKTWSQGSNFEKALQLDRCG